MSRGSRVFCQSCGEQVRSKSLTIVAEREREAMELLRVARCPDRNCDNEGTTVRMVERTVPECCGHFHDNGECCGNATAGVEAEPEPEPCQWCHERDGALAAYDEREGEP